MLLNAGLFLVFLHPLARRKGVPEVLEHKHLTHFPANTWNTNLEYNTGIQYWNTNLEYNTGIQYWNTILEYNTGIHLEYKSRDSVYAENVYIIHSQSQVKRHIFVLQFFNFFNKD